MMDDSNNLLIGVQARIEDAGILADNGRYEGAMLMLLIAVASTSRKRYPHSTPSKKNQKKRCLIEKHLPLSSMMRYDVW